MTKITNIKNDIPIYVEQKFIQTDLQAKNILKTKISVPGKFVKLEKGGRNNWGSTEGLAKDLCERYGFTYEKEWIYLDIPHELMKKLDLTKGEDIPYSVYLSPNVLSRNSTCGGITIQEEREIFIERPFNKDQSTQTETTNISEINKVKLLLNKTQSLRTKKKELLTKISELEKGDNLNQQTIVNLQGEVADLEKNLTRLKVELEREEKNNVRFKKDLTKKETDYQTQINNLQNEINQLNNNLQNTQKERDRLQQSLKRSWLSYLFKNKQKSKRISELNNSLSFLRGLLRDKNQQVKDLITEQNNLQNQINGLNRQLTEANNEIVGIRDKLKEVEIELDKRPNITLDQWNDDYSKRPTQQQLNDLQTELDNTKSELDECRNKLGLCSRCYWLYLDEIGKLEEDFLF